MDKPAGGGAHSATRSRPVERPNPMIVPFMVAPFQLIAPVDALQLGRQACSARLSNERVNPTRGPSDGAMGVPALDEVE
jgi:hypothetical protein